MNEQKALRILLSLISQAYLPSLYFMHSKFFLNSCAPTISFPLKCSSTSHQSKFLTILQGPEQMSSPSSLYFSNNYLVRAKSNPFLHLISKAAYFNSLLKYFIFFNLKK